MDDVASKLHDILNNPESMEKIKNLANMLGASAKPSAGQQGLPSAQENVQPDSDVDILKIATKFAPLVSNLKKEDNNTRLLRALRPFLSEKRQKKLDESIRLMQFVRIIPLIKKSGIF